MSLYASSSFNTNTLSSVFNTLWDKKFVPTVVRKNGFLKAILGTPEPGSTPGTQIFPGLVTDIESDAINVRVLGKLRTLTTVDSATTAIGTVTLSYNNNHFGAFSSKWTHYVDSLPVPERDLLTIRGSMAQTANYIQDLFDMCALSLESAIGNAMVALPTTTNATWSVGTESTMNSLFNIVSDGVSTFASTNANYYQASQDRYHGCVYGGLDRGDSENAQFRSYVYSAAGAGAGQLTTSKIFTVLNKILDAGGDGKIGLCDSVVMGYLQALTAQAATVTYGTDDDPQFNSLGAPYVKAFGTRYILENRLGNVGGTTQTSCGNLFILTPSSFKLYQKTSSIGQSNLVRDPSRVATYVLPYSSLLQLICSHPAQNGRLCGITG